MSRPFRPTAGDYATAAVIKSRAADRAETDGRHVTALRLRAEATRHQHTANRLLGGGC